jgi:hypothetical protein
MIYDLALYTSEASHKDLVYQLILNNILIS